MTPTRLTLLLSALLVGLGLALLIETALVGGELGYLIGSLLVLAGALRATLARRAGRR